MCLLCEEDMFRFLILTYFILFYYEILRMLTHEKLHYAKTYNKKYEGRFSWTVSEKLENVKVRNYGEFFQTSIK